VFDNKFGGRFLPSWIRRTDATRGIHGAIRKNGVQSGFLRDVTVKSAMAVSTKCYEVVFLVVPEVASRLNMVYLKILQATTVLAAPGITVQNPLP
jgi:hypothetical protein